MIYFVSDVFVDDYVGGAELTSEALIESSLLPVRKVHSHMVTKNFMADNKGKFWIFGNFSNLKDDCILYAIKNLKYSVLEYDYKFCIARSPEKHTLYEGGCECKNQKRGKIISVFFKKAQALWFMSEKQRSVYIDNFSFLESPNTRVLSSVFSNDTLDKMENLNTSTKNNKWIILDSNSWVKGKTEAIQTAKSMGAEYELVGGLSYEDFLQKLANSKGIIYTPPGGDTCPRLVIEAKLLDCELILNENVQHKDELWFQNKETTMKYLRKRTRCFWNTIEEVWNLPTPRSKAEEQNHFNFIVPYYNAEEWIRKCINSIMIQKYNNFNCYIIDDMSTDDSVSIVSNLIAGDDRFELIVNKNKRYALGNIVSILQSQCTEEESVNIILDGDDWLSSPYVLPYLNEIYCKNNCLMTYGTYVYYPNGNIGVEPSKYPNEVIENNLFRQDRWRASHLRTFKTKLWNNIDTEDLKDADNDYYKTAYDQALMLPLLELSGYRSLYIDKVMHVYNRQNPLNVDKIKQMLQYKTAQKIRTKKPYARKY
jgi:hypothetical protein